MSYLYITMGLIAVLASVGAAVAYASVFLPISFALLRRIERGTYVLLGVAVALSIVVITSNPY
jgi:hypothetical protein